MAKKSSSKRPFYFGFSLLLLLLIGVTVSVYFWQMRLQKPMEVNMAHHEHSSGAVSEAAMQSHSATGVSCESIVAKDTSGPIRKFDLTAAQTVLQLEGGKTVDAWTFNGSSPVWSFASQKAIVSKLRSSTRISQMVLRFIGMGSMFLAHRMALQG